MNKEIIKVRLENPIDGYEIDAEYRPPKMGEHIAMNGCVGPSVINCTMAHVLVLKPKLKQYDWSKTDHDCLVYLATGALCRLGDANGIKAVGIYEGWQAITNSKEIPADDWAVVIQYRECFGGATASNFTFLKEPTQYRVIGLKDGYKY